MARRDRRPDWIACRCRTAAFACVLIIVGCSEPPERAERKVGVVGTRPASARPPAAAIPSSPIASPSPMSQRSPPPPRRAFVDPPLPPELVDPPGLVPLPPRPTFTDQ